MLNRGICIGLAGGVIAIAGTAAVVTAQQRSVAGPVARYDIQAGVVSGTMGMGGGGMAAAMMGGGGGGQVQKELWLRLGSSNVPAKGGPKAEHFMPSVAKLGKSVQLYTPKQERGEPVEPERPRGRFLFYWGCGENAPKGQPIVVDLARLAAGQRIPGWGTSRVVRDWGPSLTNSKTFGRWPNGEFDERKFVKPDSSLLGAHRIAGNYTPEMNFTITKDFMPALNVRKTNLPSKATLMNWSGIAGATGYYANAMAMKMGGNSEPQDIVFWSSSVTREWGGGLEYWLSPSQVAALIRDRTVLPPTATSCTVPKEVRQSGPDMFMGTLTAYGPEENFIYPPRPSDPKAAWIQEWAARLRHRSQTSFMEMQGMSMGAQGDAGVGAEQGCRPKRGLGGILGGAIGGGC